MSLVDGQIIDDKQYEHFTEISGPLWALRAPAILPPPPLSPALPRQNRLKKLHIINFNLIHQSTNQRIAGKITTGGYRYLAFYNPPLICVNIQIIWYCDVKPQMRIFAIERLHSFHRDQLHVRHGSHVGVPDKRIQSKLFWIGTPTWRLWRHVQTLYKLKVGCLKRMFSCRFTQRVFAFLKGLFLTSTKPNFCFDGQMILRIFFTFLTKWNLIILLFVETPCT
jgi:hypothetical protein